jgi:diphthamide synthase (EF-2-diphthine--ammonia ligase)
MMEHSVYQYPFWVASKDGLGVYSYIWHRKDEERCNSLVLEVMRPVCVKLFAFIRNFVDYSKLD